MPNRPQFRHQRSALLLALISAAFAGQAMAAAAHVDFAVGSVTVAGADGRERPLVRGAELDNGDTVRTADGRAQLRFTDGAYVSLQPNSEFGIKEYRYEGKTDGSERGFFALAKGALRTVTGLIGRVNRDRYRITTPTATIGIRGTGGVIQVRNDGSTLVIGTSGIWSLTNPVGTIDVPAGVSGLAPAKPDTPPQQTSETPRAAPVQPTTTQEIPFAQGEERTPQGTAEDVATVAAPVTTPPPPPPAPTVLLSGSGYAAAVAFGQSGTGGIASNGNATATFNSAGQLTDASFSDGQIFKLDPSKGSHAQFNTDAILAWGRWIGTVTGTAKDFNGAPIALNENYPANQGLHYVIGMPTPVLPTTGSATYTLLGATSPTYVGGALGPGTFTGSLTVAFGTTSSVSGQFSAAMPDKTYTWAANGTTRTSTFSLPNVTSFSGCMSACSFSTEGFFSGASAERAGISYRISDVGGSVVGAAAFTK